MNINKISIKMCWKKKEVILYDLNFRTGLPFTNSELLKSFFDRPVAHERPWDSICSYPEGFVNVICYNNYINLCATKEMGVILGNISKPILSNSFTAYVICRWTPAEYALYCPLWIFPVNDRGGRRVKEYDVVEGAGVRVVFTAHDLPDDARIVFDEIGKELYGYKHPDKKSYPKYSTSVIPEKWMEYKMRIRPDGITWWAREKGAKKFFNFHKVKLAVPKIEYYIRVSIIMQQRLEGDGPSVPANMDIMKIKVVK